MIQFPSLNKGMLIYANTTTDDPELGRILELRVDNEFNYRYLARYFGIYCPVYKLPFGDVDRLFIKLPPVESDVAYPIYLERHITQNIDFTYDYIHFYENMFNPQNITPRQGATYHLTYEGRHFVSGRVALDHEEVPVKFKLNVSNITSHGKFHLYNPNSGYLMWTIEIDGLDIYLNDTLETTLTNSNHIEMDIGFDTTELRLNFFEDYELLDYIEDTSPMNTMPSVSDTVMEIEGLDDLCIDWLLCYKAAFKNAEVYSVLEYTDFERLVTSGNPLLTHLTRFGVEVKKSNHKTKELGVQRTVTVGNLDRYGILLKKTDHYSHSHPIELLVYNNKTIINGIEIIVQNEHTDQHGMTVGVGTMCSDTDKQYWGTRVSKTELSSDIEYGMFRKVVNHLNLELGLQRQVAYYDKNYFGIQATHIKNVYNDMDAAMTVGIENLLKDSERLLIMIKKIAFNVNIDTETYEKYKLQSIFTGGSIITE